MEAPEREDYGALRADPTYWNEPHHFMPVTATRAFYDLMRDEYPEAYDDPALWNLLGYLARGWYLHRDRRRLQLPYALLAGLSGKATKRVLSRETYPEGEDLLGDVRRIIGEDGQGRWRLTWSEAWTGNQPRLLKRLAWPKRVSKAIDHERRTNPWDPAPRVYWTERTGSGEPKRFNLARHQARTNDELDVLEARLRVDAHPITEVDDVLRLLRSASPVTLTRLVKANVEDAYRAVDRLRDELFARADQETGKAQWKLRRKGDRLYDHQMRCLEAVKEAPRPRYFVSSNSPRLFPVSDHLTGLKAEVRRALLAGLVEVDLASCHLAVLAAMLDLPTVREFLDTGESVWDHLFQEMDLSEAVDGDPSLRKRIKGVLKQEGLYPALYGRQRGYVVRRVNDELAEALQGTGYRGRFRDVGKRFVEHPMIAEILGATATKLAEIEEEGHVMDVDGHVISLPLHVGDVPLTDGATSKTALCYAASVVELKLMHAIVRLQEEQNGRRFRVLLWQHDGVSLQITDKRWTAHVVREVQEAVAREAASLGVRTRLEADRSTLPAGVSI